jgi:hypothetical protein
LAGARTGGGSRQKTQHGAHAGSSTLPHSIHTLTETNVPVSEGSPHKESPLGRDEQASQGVKDTSKVCRPGKERSRGGCNTKTRYTVAHRVQYTAYTGTGEGGPDFCQEQRPGLNASDILRQAYRHVSDIHRWTSTIFYVGNHPTGERSPDPARVTDQGFRDPITSAVRSLVMQEYKRYKIKMQQL